MLDTPEDLEDGPYLKKSGIDRSVGFLIGGVVVLAVFLLTMVEMGRIQNMSDEVTHSNRFTPDEVQSEIGNVAGTGSAN